MGKHAIHADNNHTRNTQGEHVFILRVFYEICKTYPKHSEAPSQFQPISKRYLILNKIRDDNRIIQIATERGYSCGDRRHAILSTAHITFTQQTQYIDNMATLNERQFFLLPPRHHTKSCVSQGAPSNEEISGVLSSLRGCSGTPISSRRGITKWAHGAFRSTGTAWTGHSMKKDGEEWHWCGKHPNGPYTLCSSSPPGG